MENHKTRNHKTRNSNSNSNQNYISINGQKIKLTDEQIAQMRDSVCVKGIKLSDIPVGETFKVGEYEFVVLERLGDGTTAVILKDFYGELTIFGENNNYAGSRAEEICFKFAAEIADIVGVDNLVEHTVDLTALDGRRDYGTIIRRTSLLTLERFRRYVDILDKYRYAETFGELDPNRYWWLATPLSTAARDESFSVCYIDCFDSVHYGNCSAVKSYAGKSGIRPFCIFRSSMTVSK